MKDTKAAMEVITKALEEDPVYRATWIANLSMVFYDELYEKDIVDRRKIANSAAEKFIELLTAR